MDILDLPDLALLEVLCYFDHEEKIKCLMLVCKRWYSFFQTDIQQLCIYDRMQPYRLFWDPLSKEEIDYKFIIRTKTLNQKFSNQIWKSQEAVPF